MTSATHALACRWDHVSLPVQSSIEHYQAAADLLGAEVSDSIQNRIWFNLARLRFDQGFHDQSLDLLSRINDSLPPNIEAERKFLQTNLLIGDQQYDHRLA